MSSGDRQASPSCKRVHDAALRMGRMEHAPHDMVGAGQRCTVKRYGEERSSVAVTRHVARTSTFPAVSSCGPGDPSASLLVVNLPPSTAPLALEKAYSGQVIASHQEHILR